MARTGLGRHSGHDLAVGDPLEGLVNLFDLGLVLAVAFLILGLGLSIDPHTRRLQPRAGEPSQQAQRSGQQTLPSTANAPHASGRGEPVGTVYRLANGQLVLVQRPARSR